MKVETNRRTFVATAAAAAFLGHTRRASAQTDATPAASEMPETPAGRQMAWVIAVINGDEPMPEPTAIEERFTEEFLTAVPPADLIATFEELQAAFAPIAVVEFIEPQTPLLLSFVASTSAHMLLDITISVERDEPNLIEGILFAPHAEATPEVATIVSWDELDAALVTDAGKYGVSASGWDGEEFEPIHQTNAEEPLAVGSAFKFYVLGALAEAIEAGTMAWDDEIALTEEMLSLPTGVTQDEPLGSMLEIEELALRMISISDNTATDLLLHAVGREKVEAAMGTMGHNAPELNLPFISTREMFVIKLGDEERRAAFARGDEAERREILDAIAGDPLPDQSAALDWDKPRDIDTIEWFASPDDLARALVWLHAAWQRPGLEPLKSILTANPGVPVDPDQFPVVAFKGGSEPGVMAVAWLVERVDGAIFSLAVVVNDPEELVDENAVAMASAGAIALFAEEA